MTERTAAIAKPLRQAADGLRHVLLVDDDEDILIEFGEYLARFSFRVSCARSVAEAESLLVSIRPHVVVVDQWLSDSNGVDLVRKLHDHRGPPCIMISASRDDADRVLALELGADDYLVKPLVARELVARINALLRRCGQLPSEEPPDAQAGSLTFIRHMRAVFSIEGEKVPLTGAEYDIILTLCEAQPDAVSRELLALKCLGRTSWPGDRSIDGIICAIRRKLAAAGVPRDRIKALRNRGYAYCGMATMVGLSEPRPEPET